MNIYETLIYLATEPYEKKVGLKDELKTSNAIFNELKKEFSVDSSNSQLVIDIRQACETMVYEN